MLRSSSECRFFRREISSSLSSRVFLFSLRDHSNFRILSFNLEISNDDSFRISSILFCWCLFVRFNSLMFPSNLTLSRFNSINSFSRASPISMFFKLSWLSFFLLKTSRIDLNSLFSFSNARIFFLYSARSSPSSSRSDVSVPMSSVFVLAWDDAHSFSLLCRHSLSRLRERMVSSNRFMLSNISWYLSSR